MKVNSAIQHSDDMGCEITEGWSTGGSNVPDFHHYLVQNLNMLQRGHNLLTIYKRAVLPVTMYASEAWWTTTTKRARSKLLQIQRSYLTFITKAYRTVSNEAISAITGIMPLDLAMLLHKDKRAIS
jgi:hypothetical protein